MAPKQSSNPTDLAAALARDKDAALKLVPVSRETIERLDAFVALLLQWQAKTNLVAPSTLPQLWSRHIVDSLQLFSIAPHLGTWIDLGSGGGFPGIVIACALEAPHSEVHLVERNGKKAAFLREALRVTGAPGIVHLGEIADFVDSFSQVPDYITARALAPLKVLIALSAPLIERGATALFLKGQDVEAELTEAAKYWNVRHRLHLSLTSQGSFIVEVMGAEKRGAIPSKPS
jgi:16S rRNA (guanine527-N7)-methyltransferase